MKTKDPLQARCTQLISLWESQISLLENMAALDRKEGLPHAAEVGECSALAIKGCLSGLKRVLET